MKGKFEIIFEEKIKYLINSMLVVQKFDKKNKKVILTLVRI